MLTLGHMLYKYPSNKTKAKFPYIFEKGQRVRAFISCQTILLEFQLQLAPSFLFGD
jgi:hypothetical protein